MSSLQEEREACAKLLELRTSELLLLAGEMTAQEIRTVRAVLDNRAKAIRNLGEVEITDETRVGLAKIAESFRQEEKALSMAPRGGFLLPELPELRGTPLKHSMGLQPFTTPNYVHFVQKPGRREDGISEIPSVPLSELSVETLNALCDQFKKDVFKKAGKEPCQQ